MNKVLGQMAVTWVSECVLGCEVVKMAEAVITLLREQLKSNEKLAAEKAEAHTTLGQLEDTRT